VDRIGNEVAALAVDFVPDAIPLPSVVGVFEQLDRIERLAANMKTLLGRSGGRVAPVGP
jgi:hypothetical protein